LTEYGAGFAGTPNKDFHHIGHEERRREIGAIAGC
jgi:hypothetical protein